MTQIATGMISRAFNLRLWFAIGSFGTIAALSVLWAVWTSQFLTSNLLDRESEVTQEFLESIIAVDGVDIFADYGDGGAPGPKTLDFSNHIINIPGTIRANIYAPSYRVLWSTEEQLKGKIYPVNNELRTAFGGQRVTEIEDIADNAKEEHVALKKGGLLIEAYVPIRSGSGKGPVIGVVEFYKVPTALQEKIDQGRRTVWLGAGAAALLIFATLFWIVQKGARLIESQQARLARMQTFAAIGQMAGAVAHSLRNPMAGVRSSAELWRSELPDAQRHIADDIINEVDRMDGYVRDLLAYCQVGDRTSGKVDPLQLLNGIVAKSQLVCERNNITVSLTDERSGGALVQGDPALLEQAMTSLMTNSVEAMPRGGHLTLRVVTPDPHSVRLELADTGAGIPKELIERVTESYFTTKQRGLGLGLVLAKAIIENFGGSLAISSTPQVGTSVVVDLRAA